MKNCLILIVTLLVLFIVPTANAQFADPADTGSSTLRLNYAAIPQAPAAAYPIAEVPTTDSNGRLPDGVEPPTGLTRAKVPCGGARLCPGQNPVPAPRPEIPPLTTLTTELVIDNGSCFIRFNAKAIAQPTGDYMTFSVRPVGSTGSFMLMFATYTVAGNATFLAPAKMAAGEWRAVDQTTGEPSGLTVVSNALPIICG